MSVPNGHTYLCRLAAAKGRFDNRHSISAPPQAFPLGSAVLNDTPVACQTRGPTDPQGDRCQRS
jgi:hypothetical protein